MASDDSLRVFTTFGKDERIDNILKELPQSRKVASVMKHNVTKYESLRLSRYYTADESFLTKLANSLDSESKASIEESVSRALNANGDFSEGKSKVLLKKGYMEKQGNKIKTWKLRYFHLYMQPRQFMYFEDVESLSPATTPLGGSKGARFSSISPAASLSGAMKENQFSGKTLPKQKLDDKKKHVQEEIDFLEVEEDVPSEMILPEFHKYLVEDSRLDHKNAAIKVVSLEEDGIKVVRTGNFGFEVKTSSRTWQFHATSKDNLENWTSAFEFVTSGECSKFMSQVNSLEGLIRSMNYVVKFNQQGSKSVGWLSNEDAIFVSAKLNALKNLQKFFSVNYGLDDLQPIQRDAQSAILRTDFVCRAILLRTELHDLVSKFDSQVEVIRKLIKEAATENPLARDAVLEVWDTAKKQAQSILLDTRFEKFIEGCTRDDCRYLDDRELFEKHFKEITEEIKAFLKKKHKS